MSLRKAIQQIGETFDKVENLYYGDLGIIKGNKKLVKVPNRPSFVYVRLRGARSELITARNDKVEEKYGTPVILKREGNTYSVIGKNWERYQDWDNENPSLPKHARTHTFDKDGNVIGSDGVFISGYQFLPYLLCPLQNNSTNAFIYPFTDYFNDQWTYYGNTGTISFTPYKPVSGTSLVLVSIDYENGNPYYQATTGTYISPMVTGISQILPHLPTPPTGTIVPIGAVRLTNTTQSIGWLNIYDLRKHYKTVSTGDTGGGGGGAVDSVNGQTGVVTLYTDDIAEDGSPTNLWFTGARAIASILTGFSAGAGTVSASDSILQAFQKVVGNIALKLTANAPITGATKTKITYDANGLVTAGADATASDITFTPSGSLSAVDVQNAINELDSEKQPLNGDLSVIASLSPSNDDIIQRKSGNWINRTLTQLWADLMALFPIVVGTYTPTLTAVQNVAASTAYTCIYIRIFGVCMVFGIADVDPTAAGQTQVGWSLPIASDITPTNTVIGSGYGGPTEPIRVIPDTTNDRATVTWTAVQIVNHTITCVFLYVIG